VAVSSYLSDVAGGMVVGGSFSGEATAASALDLLSSSGVRPQDISVIARDAAVAERLAGERAWTPARNAKGLARFAPRRLPSELRARYGEALQGGRVLLVVAADGQPPDTLAALFAQAKADGIEQWWQTPADLFAPPELAGPF
jgi:non-ribosomal peptide synthetase component F